MTKFFVLALAFSIGLESGALAQSLGSDQQQIACSQVRSIVPTEHGYGISQQECLTTFSFEIVARAGSITQVSMTGQTVDDVATVCEVYLLDSPWMEIAVPAPTCSME